MRIDEVDVLLQTGVSLVELFAGFPRVSPLFTDHAQELILGPVRFGQRLGGTARRQATVLATPLEMGLHSRHGILRDLFCPPLSIGRNRSFLGVEIRDPLSVHHDLLDQYTDDAIHDVVAYLWTLK